MVRFNIIGHGFLDVSDPSGVSFKAQNQRYRFAEISLGRSTEFSVPATDHNRTMLDFGEDPAEMGYMLRKVWPAQMVYDCDVVNGTIAVTGFSSEAFTCVFTIGNSEWIDAIQNRKLSECVSSWNKGVLWASGQPMDANDPNLYFLDEAIVKYDNGAVGAVNWQLAPSVRVKAYIEDILNNLGIPNLINISSYLWMVAGSMRGGNKDDVILTQMAYNNFSFTQIQDYVEVVDIDLEWASIYLFGAFLGGGSANAKAFRAKQNLNATFPYGISNGIVLAKWDDRLGNCANIASHPAVPEWNIQELEGVTITIKKGTVFFFASKYVGNPTGSGTYWGWQTTDIPTISATVTMERDGMLALGEIWFMRNNHPDMTVFEFLKSVALATGTELTVDGVDGVRFGLGTYDKVGNRKALDGVISVDHVSRRVESWGNGTKTASISFDSEDYVSNRIRSAYEIDNEQQQDTSDHVSKFSEGNEGDNGIVIEDVDVSSTPAKFKAKRWTLALSTDSSEWLQRIPTPDPVGYFDISENSTCVELRCAMQLAEFFALKPSTVLLWRGCAYLWTDASWSDGVLSLTLQRVSAQHVAITPTP